MSFAFGSGPQKDVTLEGQLLELSEEELGQEFDTAQKDWEKWSKEYYHASSQMGKAKYRMNECSRIRESRKRERETNEAEEARDKRLSALSESDILYLLNREKKKAGEKAGGMFTTRKAFV